jgi:Flp pilus assembly protein TadD
LGIPPEQRLEVALEIQNQAIATDSETQFLFMRRARILQELGRFSEALIDFQRAAQLDPKDSFAWAGQVKCLHALDRDQEIRPLILEAVSKIQVAFAKDPIGLVKLTDHGWHVARAVPGIWSTVAETADFLEEPLGSPERLFKPELAFVKGGWLLTEGDRAGYERLCRQMAERRQPSNARHAYLLARLAAMSDDPPLATTEIVDAARQAVVASNANFAQHTLALALLRDGQYQAAIDEAQKAVEMNYHPPANWMIQALAYHHLGHHELARRLFERRRIWFVSGRHVGGLHPQDRIGVQSLHDEAARVILGPAAPSATTELP